MIFLSSVKPTDGSSSGIAAIYLSFMDRVADKFSLSWTAASQLSPTEAQVALVTNNKRYGQRPVVTTTELSYRNTKGFIPVLSTRNY